MTGLLFWSVFPVDGFLLIMVIGGSGLLLLDGDLSVLNRVSLEDGGILLGIATTTSIVPMLLAPFVQRHLEPITVLFLTILEQLLSVVITALFGKRFPPFQCCWG